MKFFTRLFLLLGLLLAGVLNLAGTVVAAAPVQKTVLVLSPFQVDLSSNLIAAQAIREEFGSAADLSLDVYFEYLDLTRFPDPDYQQQVLDLLSAKYKNKPVDLVLVGSEAMLKLWLVERADILPDKPVVFFDVSSEHLPSLDLPAGVTGVSGVEDCERSLRWALQALPNVKEIVLVGGVGRIEEGFIDHIRRLQEELKDQAQFTDLSGRSLDEIKAQVAKLPKTAIILYHPMFEDAQGSQYRPLVVLREVSAAASVPVIGGYDQFIGTGIIGGYMYSIDQQARDAARIGLRVLRGEPAGSIPVAQNTSNRFIFDHPALQRFDIALSILPPESLIRNRQYTFWEQYRPQIVAAAAGIALLLLLVIYLLGLTRQLNRTRKALAQLNANLETQVQERTAMLNQANAQLQDEIAGHRQTEEKLRESEEKFRGLLDSQEHNIMMFDFDGVHQYVNQVGLVSMTGSGAPQDVIGKRLHEIYPAIIADWQLEQIRRVFVSGQGMAGDFDHDLDGHPRWWHLNLQPIRNTSGQVVQVMVNSLEITERKHAETALRDSELFVSGVLNSLTEQIAVLDEHGVIVSVNDAWKNFAAENGCPDLSCYLGVNYLSVCETAVNAGDRSAEAILAGMRAVLAGSQLNFSCEYPCDAPGKPRWFNVTVMPQSHPRKGLIVAHQNISERKQAEQALRESESSLQAVLQATADGILAVDAENRVLFVNERFAEMWRIPPEVLARRDEKEMLNLVLEQMVDPQEFLNKIQELYQSQAESFDTLDFKDGRAFERLSHPLMRDQKIGGRVWSFKDITLRRRAETRLRESEARYRLLAENVSDVIWIFDLEHARYTYVSPSILRLSGYSPEEELSRSLQDGMTAESYQFFSSELTKRLSAFNRGDISQRVKTIQLDQLHKDGTIVPTEVVTTLIANARGQVTQILGVSRDITDRKQMEEDLRESEWRTATILRLSPIVIGVSTAAEGRYTNVNDAFEQVLGYSREETIGRTSFDLNIWTDENTRADILRRLQEDGRVEHLEINLRRKSGQIFPALVFITPVILHDTPSLLTMTMDITERKRMEEQLRETRDALQTIIYSSPLAILTLDADDRVTMWNTAAEVMFGWSDKQILGQRDPTVPESKINEYEALRRASLSGMAFSNLETTRIRKDGSQVPVSLSVAPLRGQQNQVIGRMHIIADNTERKRFQEELRQQATTDELTRVSNRRHFLEKAQSELKRAVRLKRPPAIALIDIDHFKQINDTHGHAAGDQALIAFSELCQKHIREIDVFARFGGDEFVILLPETSQEHAFEVVERIRQALTAQPAILGGNPVAITISSGITSLTGEVESIDMLLSQADQALYRAKETGRNRVIRFDQLEEKGSPPE